MQKLEIMTITTIKYVSTPPFPLPMLENSTCVLVLSVLSMFYRGGEEQNVSRSVSTIFNYYDRAASQVIFINKDLMNDMNGC